MQSTQSCKVQNDTVCFPTASFALGVQKCNISFIKETGYCLLIDVAVFIKSYDIIINSYLGLFI
jgi:hypothetical protein